MNNSGLESGRTRLAVVSLTAFCICFLLTATVSAFPAVDKKLHNRADRALREGDFSAAEVLYRELLRKDSHDNQARLGLSWSLFKQRQLQDAYDHAARVLLSEPLSARAHALLGSVILATGDFRESVEEFRTAISIKEDESLAIAGLAMVDFYENRMESAVRGLRRAVRIAPSEPDYIFNLGQAAARSERYKEAADAYERFLLIAPKTDSDRRARIRGLIDFLRYLGRQGSLYVPAGGNRTKVPFDSVDTRPILLVRVNGGRDLLRFVLDTGSGMSVVSEETARLLNLRPVARGGLARAVGGGGRFEIVYGFLSSVDIGEVRVENVPVYIRRFYDDKAPVHGYLGLSVISKFIASVDYGERTFSLIRQRNVERADASDTIRGGNQASETGTSAIELPLRTTSSGFLSGEVRLEGIQRPLNFIVDTGASISVVSQKLAEQEELDSYLQPTRMRVFGAAGITEDVKLLVLPKIILGTIAQEHVSVAVLDLDPVNETAGFVQSGILGGNFLRHFRVSFDFQKGVIRLEPIDASAKASKTEER